MYNRYIPQPDGSYRRRQTSPSPPRRLGRNHPDRSRPAGIPISARRRSRRKSRPARKIRPVPISAGRSVPLPHLRPGENRPSSRLRIPFWVSAIFCTSFCQRIFAWKT